jgi:hypothetical protein
MAEPPTDVDNAAAIILPGTTKKQAAARKVDRSAAAMAMADLRRAARKKEGPGLRERNEIKAREIERTGGTIEEDLSGESTALLAKAEDFEQSRAGDQLFASEANSAVVRLQRALWYVDSIMRGASVDERGTVHAHRIKSAYARLAACIRSVEEFGVQRVLVMRANWVLSRFAKFGVAHRKVRREKTIEKLKTIIPDDWMKKTIQRQYSTIEQEPERELQVESTLANLAQFQLLAPAEEHEVSSDEENAKLKKHNWLGAETFEDGNTMSEDAKNMVDTIVLRRARRKEREKQKREKKKRDQLTTLREVEIIASIERGAFRTSRRLHQDMAHVVARPPSLEERWTEDMYEDYQEYDQTVRRCATEINGGDGGSGGGGGDGNGTHYGDELLSENTNEILGIRPSSSQNNQSKEISTEEEEFEVESSSHTKITQDAGSEAGSQLSEIAVMKKHKLFSRDELLSFRAETDFTEDVSRFLDGSGLVKNTGPAARVKFVRMMKTSYLDVRTSNLKRTKRVIQVIKKIKEMLRKVLLMPGDFDLLPGMQSGASSSGGGGGRLDDSLPDLASIDPDDIDALLAAKSQVHVNKREEDLEIFKRWAGRKVVESEPLLLAAEERVSTMNRGIGGSDNENNEEMQGSWVCKVCMQVNQENALVCIVCGRPPNAKATSWGLAKHRPRRTHPRFMHTWNQKTGRTIRQWEREEQEKMREMERSGRVPTMTEEMKEKFYLRAKEGAVVIP